MLFSSQSRLLLALLLCLAAAALSVTARFDALDTGRRGLVQASGRMHNGGVRMTRLDA